MKSKANRLGMYADLISILDAALASGGGTYTLADYGQAVHWRQRCYQFRKLYAETMSFNSKYDTLSFPRITEGSSSVIIRMIEARGSFTPAREITLPQVVDDDLLSAAEIFAQKLGD